MANFNAIEATSVTLAGLIKDGWHSMFDKEPNVEIYQTSNFENPMKVEGFSIYLLCEPLALNDYFTIWDRLRTLPLSMTYVVRMVMMDSEVKIEDGTLVKARGSDMGEVVT